MAEPQDAGRVQHVRPSPEATALANRIVQVANEAHLPAFEVAAALGLVCGLMSGGLATAQKRPENKVVLLRMTEAEQSAVLDVVRVAVESRAIADPTLLFVTVGTILMQACAALADPETFDMKYDG